MARANGCPRPHSRFWIATASAKTTRPVPSSVLKGWRKNPKVERGPKVRIAIRQPQATITAGVRQPNVDGAVEVAIAPLPAGDRRRIIIRPNAAPGEGLNQPLMPP